MLAALDQVADEMATERFVFVESDEDIHTAVERRVTELAGPGRRQAAHRPQPQRPGGHRSAAVVQARAGRPSPPASLGLQETLLARALEAEGVYLPGYTHLQRAQPVLLAHHLLAHGWALGRDVDRLLDTLRRLDVSPLGAGALAGSSLPIDPAGNAADLGFARAFDNSLDAVGDRDFVAEAVFDLALIGVHLSRIGEEWVLWTSAEFGFARLDDAYATGSSMLPQKKNPDIAELARGKAGRLIGNLTGLLATLKGLPLAYNRDLQEDKEPLFDSVEQVTLAVAALDGHDRHGDVRPRGACRPPPTRRPRRPPTSPSSSSRSGMPFREAHAVVGAHVRAALAGEGSLSDLVAADPVLGADAAALVRPGVGVRMRTSPGGAGPEALGAQLESYRRMLADERTRLGL